MWSDEMDKKLREAAENDLHSYEEKSWPKMETLLDKHLPQEKKRRRFIFFIWLLLGLGLGAGSIYLITSTSSNNKPVADQEKVPVNSNTNAKTTTPGSNDVSIGRVSTAKEKASGQANDNSINDQQRQELNSTSKPVLENDPVNNRSDATSSEKIISNKKERNQTTDKPIKNSVAVRPVVPKQKEKDQQIVKDKNVDQRDIVVAPVTDMGSTANADATPKATVDDTNKKNEVEKSGIQEPKKEVTTTNGKTADADNKQLNDSASAPVTSLQTDKNDKTKKQKGSKFSISVSLGPDMSLVGAEPGTIKMAGGIGVGYDISDRFTIRTGFYAVRKIYSADSNSYHSPFNSGPYYSKLDNVDANCLVYEIPVTVVYNFAKTKNQGWFVSTGLSSYIMKEEDYLCTYKNPAGQQTTHSYSYTGNSHIFSVLNLSGGYQHQFNNRLSFMAEPYFKLPLTGIGFGKVNLNSAGVLFTIAYKPFLKSK